MNTSSSPPLVLHLAVDYPNVYRPENTLAVRNFVQANEELEHFVVALTRTANPLRASQTDGDGKGDARVISMRYWGLPFGILLALSMYIVAWRVYREVKLRGLQPALVHGHKLTFEGLAAWWLARWLHAPLAVSIRGEAESKILRFKPHYRPFLQKVLSDAVRVYYVSAWFKPTLNRHFRIREEQQRLLPNFVAERPPGEPAAPQTDHLVTVLDLNVYRKKGLDRLLPAFRDCLASYPNAHLDVIGRGEPAAIAEVKTLIDTLGLNNTVSLLGPMSNRELQAKLSTYAGMVLPSHNETFGMVYVEALLAGVPILHSQKTGIDGFVDFVQARSAVDPSNTASIQHGLLDLLKLQKFHKDWLQQNNKKIVETFSQFQYLSDYQEQTKIKNNNSNNKFFTKNKPKASS